MKKKKASPVPTPKQVAAANAAAPSPNKVVKKKKFKITDPERIKHRLIERHGYKEDELDVLFKTPQELITFYNDIERQQLSVATEDEIGWDHTDSFDVPAEEKQRLADKRTDQRKKAYEQINQTPVAGGLVGETHVGPGNPAEPVAEQAPAVSLEEFLDAGKDLEALLAEPERAEKDEEGEKGVSS